MTEIHFFQKHPYNLIKLIRGKKQVVPPFQAVDETFIFSRNIYYDKDGIGHLENRNRCRPYLTLPYDQYFCDDWKNGKADPFDHEECTVCKPFDTYWDGYDIGFLCGEINKMVVIDNDTGMTLDEFRKHVESKFGPLPETWTVKTASGGQHLYYRYAFPFPKDVHKFIDGVDFIGDNNWVALPPFENSQGKYEWIIPPTSNLAAKLPDWVLNLKLKKLPKVPDRPYQYSNASADDSARIREALSRWNIQSINHQDWLAVGQALYPDYEREFLDWCHTDPNRSRVIKPGQIAWFKANSSNTGLGVFFNLAKENGII